MASPVWAQRGSIPSVQAGQEGRPRAAQPSHGFTTTSSPVASSESAGSSTSATVSWPMTWGNETSPESGLSQSACRVAWVTSLPQTPANRGARVSHPGAGGAGSGSSRRPSGPPPERASSGSSRLSEPASASRAGRGSKTSPRISGATGGERDRASRGERYRDLATARACRSHALRHPPSQPGEGGLHAAPEMIRNQLGDLATLLDDDGCGPDARRDPPVGERRLRRQGGEGAAAAGAAGDQHRRYRAAGGAGQRPYAGGARRGAAAAFSGRGLVDRGLDVRIGEQAAGRRRRCSRPGAARRHPRADHGYTG